MRITYETTYLTDDLFTPIPKLTVAAMTDITPSIHSC